MPFWGVCLKPGLLQSCCTLANRNMWRPWPCLVSGDSLSLGCSIIHMHSSVLTEDSRETFCRSPELFLHTTLSLRYSTPWILAIWNSWIFNSVTATQEGCQPPLRLSFPVLHSCRNSPGSRQGNCGAHFVGCPSLGEPHPVLTVVQCLKSILGSYGNQTVYCLRQTGIVFLCAATPHPRHWSSSVIQEDGPILSLRTVKIHVMKEIVKQANRTQSKTEKQHTALGRRYFKLTESIFTNATGQHYRQAWSVWFPVRLLLLLLLCFALIRDSREGARGLELNKSWRQISFINTAKGVVGGDCFWDI